MNETMNAQPVVIIGAGRSGTNMLRDVLTNLDGVDTWPCDEINYIWRYGNRDYPTDEMKVEHASPRIKNYIRDQFKSMAKRSLAIEQDAENQYLIEKTCANSLRVEFVDAIVPEAKYIFLVRDGRDVVASARKRWKAKLDIPYLVAKARYVPKTDLGYYALKYFLNRVSKQKNNEKALSVWGPKFEGMKELSSNKNLDYVCAAQWARCVELSEAAFSKLPAEKSLLIRYEDFVSKPIVELARIAEFLGMPHEEAALASACKEVKTSSVGKGQTVLNDSDADWLALIEPKLKHYNYL